MNDLPNALLVAAVGIIGTAFVALISGVFSLVGLIISKEQKLSEFRQSWIDALREDIASFTSHAIMISAYCTMVMRKIYEKYEHDIFNAQGNQPRCEEVTAEYLEKMKTYFDATYKDYAGLNACSTRIKLRLNDSPHEVDSNALLREMDKMEAVFASGLPKIDDVVVQNIIGEIERISRPLLKKEWGRVKRGERTFIAAKWVSIVFSGLLLLFVVGGLASAPVYFFGFVSGSGFRSATNAPIKSACAFPCSEGCSCPTDCALKPGPAMK